MTMNNYEHPPRQHIPINAAANLLNADIDLTSAIMLVLATPSEPNLWYPFPI